MDSRNLWAAHAAGDVDARDTLLQENLSLVHHVARQLARGLAGEADLDELVSAGTMGLMGAVAAFDAARGLAFSTFAVPRIRGAILDELRRQDHVPRSVRRKTRSIASARESLTRSLGRAPQTPEVAAELGVDAPTLWRWIADVEGAMHVPLDRGPDREGGAPAPEEFLGCDDESADERISREEEIAMLRNALLELKDQERTVLSLYYFEDLKAREIAEVMGVSESRISQIRSRALSQLRELLAPLQISA
ncbi:MAG TPA: sigma-70 family RNA polymerase sigma factor [Gemmatimonadaceae bacterium]